MEQRLLSTILVLSGLCIVTSSLRLRLYHFINNTKTWSEAQQYCREKYTDLATVTDTQDLGELTGVIPLSAGSSFLGLYRGWRWSCTDATNYREGEVTYWNWASGQPGSHYCGSITPTGEWFALDCTKRLNFFCYNASATSLPQRFTLVEHTTDWLQAQDYCRTGHTDLVRVRNQLENMALQSKLTSNAPVWIGLTASSWMWSDGSEASFIPWKPPSPLFNGPGDCGIVDTSSNLPWVKDVNCTEKATFLCYSAPKKKYFMRLKLNADDSVNMTDPDVLKSLTLWVKNRLKDAGVSDDVKLRWKKPPKKEKSKKEEQAENPQTEVKCAP